jgi:DNA-binding transcriptional LysR family regulator
MNDRQLRYAHAVWRERSFSRAAAKMGVSQPSLSEQIRLLEEEMGFSLFYRNSRGVEASANGQSFLASVESVLDGFSGLKDLARELRGKPGATIRVGVNSGLAQNIVPRIVRILSRSTVKIRPDVITGTTRRIQRLVHQQRLDLGLVLEGEVKAASDKLVRDHVADSEVVALVPPSHPFAKRRDPVTLAELCRAQLIVNEPRIGYGHALLALCIERGLTPDIAGDCDDMESLKYMVQSGAGVAIAPRIAAEREIAAGLLRALPIDPAQHATILLVRREEALPPRLDRFRLALGKELAELLLPEPKVEA